MMKLHDVTMSGAYRIFSTAAARCWMLLIPMRRRKEEGTSETSSSLRGRQALTDAPRVGSVSFDGAAPASCHGCPDQKMEALGRLTGGVAHEFNNLLTVVLGNATSLRLAAQARGDDHEVRKASAIEQAAQRGGRLAAQLLAYSQRQALLPRILSVFDVLSNLHDLLSRAAGEAVQLRLHADDDLWRCHLDEGELEAAALNLVLNARDAMPTGGLVSITCRNERVEAAPLGHGARTPGDYVRLDVADSGIGIPEELHQRVFEPFFTTKPVGSGSGLGLAQVHGFVGQSGGWVELSSTPGHGTTISMFLPRAGDREEGWPEDRVVRATQPEPSAGGVSEADSRAESEQAYRELRQRSDMRGTRALPLQSRRQDSAPVVARIPVQDLENTIQTSVRIAVAPLRAIGSDADRDIAVGFAEELTAALSRFRWISCVAPLSVSALSDNSPAGAANWRALELDYLINGSLYRTDDKVRITIRLISQRQRGEIAWTKDYASDLIDILRLQDDIAAETAAQVGPELLIWEGERAAARAQVDPSSYALVLRAIPAVYRLDEAGFRAAGQLLNEAVTADPSSAAAHSWLAHWYLLLIGQGWSKDIPRTAAIAHEHAVCAIKLDPGDARGLTVAGHVEAFLYKRPMQALRLHDLALNRNPNLALAWCYAGLANSYVGRHAEAIEHIRRAQRLSPHDPHRFFFDTCMVMPLLLTGDYDNAARIGRRAVAANPALSSAHKGLISTLGLMGRVAEAQEFREQLEALEPRFSVEDAISRSPLTQPVDLQRYAEGLRRAGCRERLRRIPFQRQLKPIGWRTRPPDVRADAS